MNSAQVLDGPVGRGLASWYTPGRTDGFGDRLLMCDNTGATSLELLRFRHELAVAPGFDDALRDGVDRAGVVTHPSFPAVRAVVYLDEQDLTLVSAHVEGQRLSGLWNGKPLRPLHPAIVTWIVREVTSALAALHASARCAVHGALHADRIVFTPDGRVCVVEQALGPGVQRLGFSSLSLWREFGLLALADERGLAQIDARNDVAQLGAIALSLLLGRQITFEAFQDRRELHALLEEFTAMSARTPSASAAPLRVWLEHALQIAPHPYRSAADAYELLKELPESSAQSLAFRESAHQEGTMNIRSMRRDQLGEVTGPRALMAPAGASDDVEEEDPWGLSKEANALSSVPAPQRSRVGWIALGLGLTALVEGGIIAALAMRPAAVAATPASVVIESPTAGDTVLVDGKPAGTTPLKLAVNPGMGAIRLVPAVVPAVATPLAPAPRVSDQAGGDQRTLETIEAAAAQQRSGGVRISSPIELKVLEGDRVLGSTADGPIVTTAGPHQFDLINTVLGVHVHQSVTIRGGVLAPLSIAVPMGRLSINAEPWAQVTIDNKPIGDTPLANVSVSVGEHEVLFRNPQLGERRETVVVRADAPTRVSTSFQR